MPYKDDSDDDVVGFGQPNHTDGAKNPFADHSDDEGLGGGQSDGQMMTSQRMMMEGEFLPVPPWDEWQARESSLIARDGVQR